MTKNSQQQSDEELTITREDAETPEPMTPILAAPGMRQAEVPLAILGTGRPCVMNDLPSSLVVAFPHQDHPDDPRFARQVMYDISTCNDPDLAPEDRDANVAGSYYAQVLALSNARTMAYCTPDKFMRNMREEAEHARQLATEKAERIGSFLESGSIPKDQIEEAKDSKFKLEQEAARLAAIAGADEEALLRQYQNLREEAGLPRKHEMHPMLREAQQEEEPQAD